ncbi:MAG: YeeE/YedE family protein [Actinomycetes bacterium]
MSTTHDQVAGVVVPDVARSAGDVRAAGGRPRPVPEPAPPARRGVLAAGLAGSAALAALIAAQHGAQLLVLFVLGLGLGLVLFHSRFGFTSAWRQLVAVGQGSALRAHMLMLGAAAVLFAPLLAVGAGLFGTTPTPSVAPLGAGVVVGAFLFGVGMQVGGACASGTLFAVGSGQTSILLTLAGFVGGSVVGAAVWGLFTQDLPALPGVDLAASRLGYPGALVVSLLVMALVVVATRAWERRRGAPPAGRPPTAQGWARVVRGSWPLAVGAVLLAALNAATLLVKGSPWGVTSAFALWGSKIAQVLGVDVTGWRYWADPGRAASLEAPVLSDATSVMNIGIVLGALVASAAAGTFVLHRGIPPRLAVGAVLGGVLMGIGARIAYGCNIGAYFGGIASFSLHGWLWGLLAVAGTVVGLRLRPWFGLANPKPTDSVC